MNVWLWLFGEGEHLDAVQMVARCAAIFCIALLLVRLSGRRSFGQHSPFDACTTVLLGAILSRAVVGASPFWPTVAAAAALAVLHRVVGHLAARIGWFERIVSGPAIVLFSDGQFDRRAMRRAQISEKDISEAARKQLHSDDLSRVDRALLEHNGDVSITTSK
jgi:uncharacterized membrane protein YcaP (DUF421 family)